MAADIKEIKVFLSCPGDVVEEGNFLDIAESSIRDANSFLKNSGLQLELRHWKKNVHLGRGEPRVQDRINNRLVDNCDIFIGVLWTKFGSSPGVNPEGTSYGSGTEEEFNLARELDKEIWILFSHCPINPWKIDFKQFSKVKAFKEALKCFASDGIGISLRFY